MKAMIWKELRENLKWALLAMLALGLAEFYCLLEMNDSSNDSAATLCKSSFLTATTFGCAVAGIILGLVQILPEQKRDQWAALLHRPVTRGTIFRGKAFAGILLYLLATIPPFLACIWYVATPGHYAVPFLPAMTLPGIADICAGTMFYFAALFVGVRRGPWYGARIFGFPAALIGSAFVNDIFFGVSIGVPTLMALVLFTAGCGAISTNGALRDQPWFVRFATVGTVVCGAFALSALTLSILFMFSLRQAYYGTSYNVDLEGRPLKFIQGKDGLTVTDLTGSPVHDQRFTTGSSYNYLLSFAQVTDDIMGDFGQRKAMPREMEEGYRNNRTYVVAAAGAFNTYTESWYYLPQERQFVGYYTKTKQRIGAIGLNGFRPGYEEASPFPARIAASLYNVPAFVQFGSTVYHNDFDQRKLTPIFSEPGTPVFGTAPMESAQDHFISQNWAAVALLDKMLVVDKAGQVLATLPYHQDMTRWGSVYIAVTPSKDRFFLQYYPSQWINYKQREKMPSFYEEMDAKGNLLHTYTLPPIAGPVEMPTWQGYPMEYLLPPPIFVVGYLAYDKVGALCGSKELASDLDEAWTDEWGSIKSFLICGSTASFLFALVTIAWARRMHFSWGRTWAWALLVLAFNIAGFITFRLVADWPVCVPCPQCNRKRPVEEIKCPHCQSLWPAPKLDGIEIFEKRSPIAQTVS